MAKRIRFSLKMTNGEQVRNIDDLKENFDLGSVIGYFADGKLLTWLEDRYLDKEVQAVKELKKDDPDLGQKICEIFGVKYEPSMVNKVDVASVERRNQKLAELKQYTTDTSILEKIDNVAMSQKEFQELLEKKLPEIFLLANTYSIPIDLANVTLIGIGEVIAQISSSRYIDFEKRNVAFKNIRFDEVYQNIAAPEERKKLEKLADEKYKSKDYLQAMEIYQEAARMGSAYSYVSLGEMYQNGIGVEKSLKNAFDYYEKAAKLNDGQAYSYLGDFYRLGLYVDKDGLKSLDYYKKAVEEKFDGAYTNIGILYWFGCAGIEQDGSLAIKYLNKAAECGRSMAKYFLGLIYSAGDIVDIDIDKSISYLLEAGKEGVSEAYSELGGIYILGEDVPKDVNKGLYYLEKSGDEGHLEAYIDLGDFYMSDDFPEVETDVDKARRWYEKAAEKGSAAGCHFVGTTFYGTSEVIDGRKRFYPNSNSEKIGEAVKWYEKAANMGFVKSCYQLGSIYSSNLNSPLKDDMDESWAIAEKWYSKGLELGDKECAYSYGSRYESGSSIDMNKAISIYTKGAELGDESCMYALAKIYFEGRGSVAQDLDKAEQWASRAVEESSGAPYYSNLLKEIQKANGTYREKFVIDGSPRGGGCFITTAVCESLNKPDDCDELMTMRWYRDKLKAEDPDMADLIKEYYRVAPLVVKKIDDSSDAPMVYRQLWENYISRIYGNIKLEEYSKAKLQYVSMLEGLCVQYDEPLNPGIDIKIKRIRLQNS